MKKENFEAEIIFNMKCPYNYPGGTPLSDPWGVQSG